MKIGRDGNGWIDMTLEDLQARRTRMIDYLKLKTDERDWHGVADAAMDLREIEASMKTLQHQQAQWDRMDRDLREALRSNA